MKGKQSILTDSTAAIADPIQFIDHRKVEWQRVKRIRYFCYQRFLYQYPGPVHNLRQNLVVVPTDHYGDQRLHSYRLSVSPYPAAHQHSIDCFGNRVFKLEVAWLDRSIAFEVRKTVERVAGPHTSIQISAGQAGHFLRPTRLTASDDRIAAVARELAEKSRNSYELAEHISDWVAGVMSYGAGATGVTTTAAQALAIGQGLCQDYAHVMIAICRAAGLPARYVSGHMLGEGGSHAWVEVLIPSKHNGHLHAFAFDPTNRRRPNLGYTTVAIGRDYCDVSPTSGTYTAPYAGSLSFDKRAGLTLIEFSDGEVMSSA